MSPRVPFMARAKLAWAVLCGTAAPPSMSAPPTPSTVVPDGWINNVQAELTALLKDLGEPIVAETALASPVRLKTPAQARADMERQGVSIGAWAREHGLSPSLVYEVLRGNPRRRCLRGDSHRAAVLLGIKDGDLTGAA